MPTKLQGKTRAGSWSDGTEWVTKKEDDNVAIVNKDTFIFLFLFENQLTTKGQKWKKKVLNSI
jgi:hypothetical protein